ncbi:MAG: sigma-54 dependent transcriptional regulator [Alphaproteobacteria bacterium]
MPHDILIVDDEQDIRLLVAGILEDEGYQPRVAGDSAAALAMLEASPPPALMILDIWLQGSDLDGIELLKLLRRKHPDLPVIMISGHGNIETAVSAIKLGAYDFIEKPFQSDRLLLQVTRALEAAELRRENTELKLRVGPAPGLIGDSSAMSILQAAVTKVAPTGSRIMISGPAGSGKEVIARLIHENSYRRGGPFVVVNSAMMRPDNLEIELFGTEQGYPDANSPRRIGTFERAHGGTLFFDEVADMPLETQGKMVRVIQEQSFERVGGSARVEVDVRVIAASNRDLGEEISAKRFREDLFYRLNVVPITMPALRDRREDIPELARHFMKRAAESSGLPPREIADDAMAVLQSCEWPGNVRQLRNVIEWMLIMSPGTSKDVVTAAMLPPELGAASSEMTSSHWTGEIMALSLRDAREVFEREYLATQLSRFGGNISRTAQFVGMERSALHRKLKGLKVTDTERPRDRARMGDELNRQ